ncbi:MAG: citrate synthase [Planctomycetes bacterium]|nr:citrate synthase [Planctomycetota bacterium]
MSTSEDRVVVRGLEGVCAAETRVSYVDGVNGELFYSGYNIHDLADKVSYEEVIYLLWHDHLPNKEDLWEFKSKLVAEMRLPAQVIHAIELTPPGSHPMSVLRTGVSMLGMFDPDAQDNCAAANGRKAIRLVAAIPTIVANLHRIRTRQPVLSADPGLGVAANFLYMLRGTAPDEEEAKAMDLLMVLHADHGLNASTFAARVAASTETDMHSALTAAIGTLKGHLHGGANQKVMEMLVRIDGVGMVQDYIHGMLDEGHRIMGFGHRVYKTEDPRASHLRGVSQFLCKRAGQEHLYNISHRIEEVVKEAKGIYPNVDFYSATVQHALGIPKEFFTAVFAASRCAGWVAHILEQYRDNRLIRPTSKYVGKYGRKFAPLDRRE